MRRRLCAWWKKGTLSTVYDMADTRPWGKMWKLLDIGVLWIKIIKVFPGEMTSIQRHRLRSELHLRLYPTTAIRLYPAGTVHSVTPGVWLEVAWGRVLENDNERLYDPHQRV